MDYQSAKVAALMAGLEAKVTANHSDPEHNGGTTGMQPPSRSFSLNPLAQEVALH